MTKATNEKLPAKKKRKTQRELPHNMKTSSPRRLELAKRRNDVLQMRLEGMEVEEIAKAIGVDKSTISLDLKRVWDMYDDSSRQAYHVLRAVEDQRLELGRERLEEAAEKGDIDAIAEQRKHGVERRKLFGLDAAKKFEFKTSDGDNVANADTHDFSKLSKEEFEQLFRLLEKCTVVKAGETIDVVEGE